jgi:hypothetical protein
MGALILPSRFNQQPQNPVIDWSHPLARGLVSLLWAGDSNPRDLVNTGIAFTVNGPTPSTTLRGKGYKLATRSSLGIYGPRGGYGKAQLQLPLSLLWIGEVIPDNGSAGAYGGVGDGQNGGYIVGNSFGNRRGLIRLNGSAVSIGNVQILKTGPNALGMVADGANLTLYEAGLRKESAAASGTVNYDVTFGRMELFGNVPDGAVGMPGTAHYQAVWNRALSDAEMASLSANPWQLFAAPRRLLVAAATSELTATLSATLDPAVAASAATVNLAASLAASFGPASITASATAATAASLAKTLAPATVTSSGAASIAAALAASLGPASSTAAATVAVSAASSTTLGAASVAATASVTAGARLAVLNATLAPLALNGAASALLVATQYGTLGALGATATARLTVAVRSVAPFAAAAVSAAGALTPVTFTPPPLLRVRGLQYLMRRPRVDRTMKRNAP